MSKTSAPHKISSQTFNTVTLPLTLSPVMAIFEPSSLSDLPSAVPLSFQSFNRPDSLFFPPFKSLFSRTLRSSCSRGLLDTWGKHYQIPFDHVAQSTLCQSNTSGEKKQQKKTEKNHHKKILERKRQSDRENDSAFCKTCCRPKFFALSVLMLHKWVLK